MSINAQCSEAIDRLIASGRVFTEIDVVNEAAQAHEWSKPLFRKGLRAANIIVGTRFRERKLARYGPVQVPGHGPDFARIATKIAYASAEKGPAIFTGPDGEPCPNGRFPRMLLEDVPDELNRKGRRAGAKRNDLQPWDMQDISTVHVTDTAVFETAPEPIKAVSKPPTMAELTRKNAELAANLDAAHSRIQQLEDELTRARQQLAKAATGGDEVILELLTEMQDRIVKLEHGAIAS